MSNRSQYLLDIRPEIASARITENMSKDERFQNLTLRPTIKFQNFLLVAAFKNYIKKHKDKFYELSLQKRLEYIENAIQKDIKLRNSLKGMLIGQFTLEEYECYIQNSSALNKRMMNMVIERLKNQIQLFEKTPELIE
ncbi:glyoxalase [Spongiimicrobium salis]|uniref:glyoxalase n=1 Tax=Spongiimicrobium salis TaxID=1667022 RepID=UPI00374CC47C